MKVEIGQTIKQKRVEQGLSLRKLGEMTNVPFANIRLWEGGGGSISADALVKISIALGVDLTECLRKAIASAKEEAP